MDESSWLFAIGFFLIFGHIFARIFFSNEKEKRKRKRNEINNLIETQKGFKSSKGLMNFPYSLSVLRPYPVGLAIDEDSKQICLVNGESLRLINFQDLIESEVVSGGNTVIKTSRASQFTGAAIGGLLFGGVGAVVGGLSGKKVENTDMKSALLKLLVNDINNPTHVIDFVESEDNGQKTNLKIALENAQKWHDIVSVIIRKAEHENQQANNPSLDEKSLSEQIYELSELHKSGVLTDNEFTNAKNKLIS